MKLGSIEEQKKWKWKEHFKKKNDNEVNIIKLFSDIRLSESIPSSKLILDEYDNSYYKIFKENIENNKITKEICKKWIKDSKINTQYVPYFKYIYPANVVVFYIYLQPLNLYALLIIHKDSLINLLIQNENKTIDRKNIQDIIKIVNDFIKKDINKHILYSTHRLELFENINDTNLITGELHIPDDDYKINSLNQFFKNLFSYVRVVEEEKTKSEIYLRYKRVANYDNMSVIDSVISSLMNPNLSIPQSEVLKIISDAWS